MKRLLSWLLMGWCLCVSVPSQAALPPVFEPQMRVRSMPVDTLQNQNFAFKFLDYWLRKTSFPFYVVFVTEVPTTPRTSVDVELQAILDLWGQHPEFRPFATTVLVIDITKPTTIALQKSRLWQDEFEQRRSVSLPFVERYLEWLHYHPTDVGGAVMILAQLVDCQLSDLTGVVQSSICSLMITMQRFIPDPPVQKFGY